MDLNKDSKPPQRRKLKFQPKAPPPRVPKVEVKSEVVEEDNKVAAKGVQDLLRRHNENAMNRTMKHEKKVLPSQIAFGAGGQSTYLKSYGTKGGSKSENSAFNGVTEKEYKEPWELETEYPIVHPLRKPYSGNPEKLDEKEFGEAAESRTYDESAASSAVELDLLEENPEASAFFMKLPPVIPMIKKPDVDGKDKRPGGYRGAAKLCKLNDLPPGLIGKMLVYKSGKVKLKLGNTLYDVSSGMNCIFAQEFAAINTAQKFCSALGEINKFATVTPDIDAALDCLSDLNL